MEVTVKNMPVLETSIMVVKKNFFFNLERDGNQFGMIKIVNLISSDGNRKEVFMEMSVNPEIAAIWNMTPENSQEIIQKNYPELHPLSEDLIKFLLKNKKLEVHQEFIDSFNGDLEPKLEILKSLTFVTPHKEPLKKVDLSNKKN